MRCFFVASEELDQAVAVVRGGEARHIAKVLRLGPGALVRLADGRGLSGEGRILKVAPGAVTVEILHRETARGEPSGELVVAQGFLKDRKMDDQIRALTELGITAWWPFVSGRSVAQPDRRRLAGRQARWARITQEAVKQCRRSRVPAIEILDGWGPLLAAAAGFDAAFVFWEEARCALPAPSSSDRPRRVLVVLGPEGGFSASEAHAAQAVGLSLTSLGPRILRAETAALAAVALVQYFYGDLTRPPAPEPGAAVESPP
jgi:16S rRNA (uracil1498-N3)-methyltransferase